MRIQHGDLEQKDRGKRDRDELVVGGIFQMRAEIGRVEVDFEEAKGGVLGLECEFALVGWELVPLHTAQGDADGPQLRIYQFRFQELDENRLLVVVVTMDLVPLAVPVLQIIECATDKREGLRVDTTM